MSFLSTAVLLLPVPEQRDLMILAIERNPPQMENLTDWLEVHNHDLLCATCVVQALRWLQTVRPDVVLIDVAGLHGFEVYRWLRSQSDYGELPVILLVSQDQTWSAEQAEIVAHNRVLTGSLTPEKLGSQISELLGRHASDHEAIRDTPCDLRTRPVDANASQHLMF